MQPSPPQPDFPRYGQHPAGPGQVAPPKPRANAVAAMIAGVLAVLTAGMLVWFALYNVRYANEPGSRWTGLMAQNAVFGLLSAGSLVVAAGFTFARRIPGAWTLFALCVFSVVAVFVGTPLLSATPLSAQLRWLFSFDDSDSTAIALMIIFGALTAVAAAIAGSVKSHGGRS